VVTIKAARKLFKLSALTTLLVGSSALVAVAQDNTLEETYANLLQQIANKQVAIDQKQLYLKTQEDQIASLREQLASVEDLKASVKPLVVKMAADVEKEMNKDVPFNASERFDRLAKLKEDLAKPDAPIASLFRQAMNIYDIEVVAGASIASYNGEHPKTPGVRLKACDEDLNSKACDLSKEIRDALPEDATRIESDTLRDNVYDGYYLHFGRLALIYLQFDSSEGWRWDQSQGDWVQMSASDLLNARRAVRIARGESAPDVVLGPVEISG
jgi:hypothetical protein